MDRLGKILAKAGIDGFMMAIVGVILFGYFFPKLGIMEKPVSLDQVAGFGVTGIFFFYGLKLNFEKLKKGLANWKMHVLIQACTFLLFPLLMLLIKPVFNTESAKSIWIGLFFLAALPSTVSSSVVMVSIAGGNIPGAIFNASISALMGVFLTPVWVNVCLATGNQQVETGSIVIKLLLQVLLPVVLGILLNKRFGQFAEQNKKGLKIFDQTIILLIIYASFSKSFTLGLFRGMSILEIFGLAAGLLLLFFVILLSVKLCAKLLGFDRADTITSIFCASKKSLVHGTVMSKVLFMNSPAVGIILLPLMMYHALQILASSILAQGFSKTHE